MSGRLGSLVGGGWWILDGWMGGVEWELPFHKCNIIFIYLIKLELVQ